MAAADEGHQQVHRDGTVGRTVTHVTDPRAQLGDGGQPECAQTSRCGDGHGQLGAGQATAHAGLGDRNVETEPVKQVHVLARRRARFGVGGVAPAGGHSGERLEYDAVRRVDGELGVVVGGRHLDHVDPGDVVLVAELTHQP